MSALAYYALEEMIMRGGSGRTASHDHLFFIRSTDRESDGENPAPATDTNADENPYKSSLALVRASAITAQGHSVARQRERRSDQGHLPPTLVPISRPCLFACPLVRELLHKQYHHPDCLGTGVARRSSHRDHVVRPVRPVSALTLRQPPYFLLVTHPQRVQAYNAVV